VAVLVYLYLPYHHCEQQQYRRCEGTAPRVCATPRQEGLWIVPRTLCQQQMKMNGQPPSVTAFTLPLSGIGPQSSSPYELTFVIYYFYVVLSYYVSCVFYFIFVFVCSVFLC
jgi:hypothetical protein